MSNKNNKSDTEVFIGHEDLCKLVNFTIREQAEICLAYLNLLTEVEKLTIINGADFVDSESTMDLLSNIGSEIVACHYKKKATEATKKARKFAAVFVVPTTNNTNDNGTIPEIEKNIKEKIELESNNDKIEAKIPKKYVICKYCREETPSDKTRCIYCKEKLIKIVSKKKKVCPSCNFETTKSEKTFRCALCPECESDLNEIEYKQEVSNFVSNTAFAKANLGLKKILMITDESDENDVINTEITDEELVLLNETDLDNEIKESETDKFGLLLIEMQKQNEHSIKILELIKKISRNTENEAIKKSILSLQETIIKLNNI